MALAGSRAPTRKYCTLNGPVPVFCTVKAAVVVWLTAGEAGESTMPDVTVSCPVALLLTVTLTAALVVVALAVFRARAANMWLPFATVVVLNEVLYGAAVISLPVAAPSTRN